MKTGLVTGRGTIVENCIFNTEISVLFDGETSQKWLYGVTLANNTHAGEPTAHVNMSFGGGMDAADIKPHEVALTDVYANVKAYRDGILGIRDDTPPPPPAPVATFTASLATVELGQAVTLNWTTANATTVTLNGQIVSAAGAQSVTPAVTKVYTLTAIGAGGTTTKTVTVIVVDLPDPLEELKAEIAFLKAELINLNSKIEAARKALE